MKHKIFRLLILSVVLCFAGCNHSVSTPPGSETALTPTVTVTPDGTDNITPEITDVPVITVVPAMTDAPTEIPNTTVLPTATLTPTPTPTPEPTATPTSTPTLKPTVTPTPEPTATPVPSLANGETITFDSSNLSYYTSYGASLTKQANDSVSLSYQQQYGQIYFKFPYPVQMKDCAYITLKFESEYAPSAIKLMGKDFLQNAFCPELFVDYNLSGDGIIEYTFTPDVLYDAYGIGFMSMKDDLDFSGYDATFYSITFHSEPFNCEKNTQISLL